MLRLVAALALVLTACGTGASEAERDGCAYLHFMASAVTAARDGASLGDFDPAQTAYSQVKLTGPPRSLMRADDEDSRNLREYVTQYRTAALEALDAVRNQEKVNVDPLQAGAREVWDGRECGESTGYQRWDQVE